MACSTATAPTVAPLESIEPTSVVSRDFIEKNLPGSGNYDEAIKFVPSVFDTAPNGPGLAESQNISIRGFQDGQFNVLFDGIPWADANDFTHHTTSYLMAHDVGQISVDRGPGTASTHGNATFGGTVYILSKAPSDEMTINPYVSYGSFDTQVYGVALNSGKLNDLNGGRLLIDAEGLTSGGYLTNMGLTRENVFAKYVQPIGSSTTLTIAGLYNTLTQYISLGATAAEIAAHGPNYALSTDPTNQNYYKYNQDQIHTDFEYADLESDLADGWNLDGKLYSSAYYHIGYNGEDPNGEYPNITSIASGDVPGQRLRNEYRSIGTILRVTKDFSFGDMKAGIWYDHQANTRSLVEVDFTRGQAPNLDDADTGATNGIDRLLHQTLQTVQPYFQLDWKPIDGLTISPGVRYSRFDRNVDAGVNVKTALPQSYDNVFESTMPSVSVNYLISPGWSAYAQAGKGALAPNENFFNRQNPSATSVAPEESWNYQVGTVIQRGPVSFSGDLYYIDFSNLIGSRTSGGQTTFFNQGGVTYKGIEAETTVTLGYGFAVYGNATLNSAKDQSTGQWIANAPDATAALGLIYSEGGYYGSLMGKWVGSRYGDVGQTQGLDPFYTLDLSLGVNLAKFSSSIKDTWLKLQVNNLTNVTKIVNLAGYTVLDGTPLYWTQPARSAFASLDVKF